MADAPNTRLKSDATTVATDTAVPGGPAGQFAADVRHGLSRAQKTIPCKYLYDELGSALFEAITVLPEYPVTRAEETLLNANARNVAEALVPGVIVAELGSGGGKKTGAILDAILGFQADVAYHPIDISPAALDACRLRLGAMPGVSVRGVEGLYLDGLRRLAADRDPWPPMLVLFLGSNIGNFDAREALAFLRGVRDCLRPGDSLLVGADLRKPVERLLAAYDDEAGVTSAFNLNLLGRVNRELGGNFDLRSFRHEARWCESESRVEMHLVSLVDQVVRIAACDMDVEFAAGESIWTESSYKFDPAQLDDLAAACGFGPVARWTSEAWPFAECLWVVT
jgi:dimethylhistidine N-methyltransferase